MMKHWCLRGIRLAMPAALALCLFSVAHAGNAVPVLQNPGFELPLIADASLSYGVGDYWAWTGYGSTNRGAAYGTGASALGYQYAALQASGNATASTITQTLNNLTVGATYKLSFQAAAIEGFSGVNPFSVNLNGSALSFGDNTVLSPSTAYATYSTTFTATATTATLQFADYSPWDAGRVSFVDDIRLSYANPGTNLVVNGSFETPAYVTPDTHVVNPAGAGWTFTDVGNTTGSGIDFGNLYTANNSVPFHGAQQAWLQGAHYNGMGETTVVSMEQLVSGFVVGQQYQLTFEAEALAGLDLYVGNSFSVSIGGELVSFGGTGNTTVNPSASYEFFVSDVFTATDTSMNLRFFDAGGQEFTHLAVIDNVAIAAVPEPASIVFLMTVAGVGAFWFRRHKR